MAEAKTWTVVIIVSHDVQTYFEYNDLEQSVIDHQVLRGIGRYVMVYYDQLNRSVIIKELAMIDKAWRFIVQKPVITGVDFYDSKTLGGVLRQHVYEKDSDQVRYLVITWGHATGLGLFRQDDKSANKNSFLWGEEFANAALFKLDAGRVNSLLQSYLFLKTHFNLSVSDDLLFKDILQAKEVLAPSEKALLDDIRDQIRVISAPQLNDIFMTGFGDRKIDILVTINCYTQMVETGYVLKEKVDLLVAPQASIPLTGINYSRLFYFINENPDADVKVIAREIVSGYKRKYGNKQFKTIIQSRYPTFAYDKVSFSCNRLQYYDDLLNVVNSIAGTLRSYLEGPRKENAQEIIMKARQRCEDMSVSDDHGIIDLENFLNNVVKEMDQIDGKVWRKHKKDLKKAKKDCNLALQKAAKRFYQPDTDNKTLAPHFVSIFFPEGGSVVEELLKSLYFHSGEFSTLSKGSEWDNFLKSFYRLENGASSIP